MRIQLVVYPRQTGKVLMMQKFGVQIALEGVAEARAKWREAKAEFDSEVNTVMGRLLHEAAANYMSAEEVAKFSGYKIIQVRSMMRLHGLDPRNGKSVLADTAAKALAENADLLGVAPHEVDLMSPLAYLPMGEQLRQELTDKTVSQVHELPDETVTVSRNDLRAVLDKAEYITDVNLRGPVDRMGDALAIATMRVSE